MAYSTVLVDFALRRIQDEAWRGDSMKFCSGLRFRDMTFETNFADLNEELTLLKCIYEVSIKSFKEVYFYLKNPFSYLNDLWPYLLHFSKTKVSNEGREKLLVIFGL